MTILPSCERIFSLREVHKALTLTFFLWSIKTTSQTKIFLFIGEFDRGAILNKKPVSPRSDMRAKRTTECDTPKVASTVLPESCD